MTKGASSGAKRRQIANYMDSLPEEFEVLEDNLDADEPSIKLQTKTRLVSLSCDIKGKVVEDFTMRKGAGSKADFLVKQEAYNAISQYYNDYYTGAKIAKKSFEEGILKIELENRMVTLSYDAVNKIVEEKDRARRKPKEFQQMSLFDLPKNSNNSKKFNNEAVDIANEKEKKYERWPDGAIVKNICNNKEYKVKKDEGNIIEVFDNDYGYLIMARSDLILV